MKIAEKTVIRAEVHSWIGLAPGAHHWYAVLVNTERHEEHESTLMAIDRIDAEKECISLFNEYYGWSEYVLLFCSRAAFLTL